MVLCKRRVAIPATLAFLVDRATKLYAIKWFDEVGRFGPLRFHVAFNSGASFGILSGSPRVVTATAAVVSLLMLATACFLSLRKKRGWVELAAISGAGLSNWLDRILYKGVMDFIEIILPFGLRYPRFNVADMILVVATFSFVWRLLRRRPEHPEQTDE